MRDWVRLRSVSQGSKCRSRLAASSSGLPPLAAHQGINIKSYKGCKNHPKGTPKFSSNAISSL